MWARVTMTPTLSRWINTPASVGKLPQNRPLSV